MPALAGATARNAALGPFGASISLLCIRIAATVMERWQSLASRLIVATTTLLTGPLNAVCEVAVVITAVPWIAMPGQACICPCPTYLPLGGISLRPAWKLDGTPLLLLLAGSASSGRPAFASQCFILYKFEATYPAAALLAPPPPLLALLSLLMTGVSAELYEG